MKLPDISGKFTTPKPWQIAVGAVSVALFVFVAPAITHVLVGEKKKKDTAQLTTVGRIGEVWHPASFPAERIPPVIQPPPPPPVVAPPITPPMPAVAGPAPAPTAPSSKPSGKEPVDPEQEAINAPIQLAAAPGQGGGGGGAATQVSQTQHARNQSAGDSAMAGLLKPTELTGFSATRMKHPNLTVPQGTVIQCNTVTRMTSGLPGFVKAKVSHDVWSADRTMKLIDRDSTIFGEIGHGLANGQDRLFVLWHQITTPEPDFVRITLNSPAADEMGEAGLTGNIDRHLKQKIGGALLLSGIESVFSGLSGALSNIGHGNGNSQSQGLNLNFSQMGSQGSNLASQLLASTIQIPDTMTINQAAPCAIFVAGDLDFSSVYETRRAR